MGSVLVRDVPVELFIESQDHQVELLRELRLIDMAERFSLTDAAVPKRLVELISRILTAWEDVRTVTRHQAMEAREQGEETVDLIVPVRPGLTDALHRWLELLTEADEFCDRGELLTVGARPEVRQLRQRYVEEIVRQLV
jgi:hypothetical protein